MVDFQLKTAVAFIIFNRPDTTERVFAEIARARPPKLLVVGDGARTNREGEAAKVDAARSIIKRVNWPCEVLTNFSDINLGCRKRVSSGLDWVFDQVDEAIVLEDDCLPHSSFFRFCEEMLEHYRYDQRISIISGNNFDFGYRMNDNSYYFSRNSHIWGWASWRDRWTRDYDVELKTWPALKNEGTIKDLFYSKKDQKQWEKIFDRVHLGEIDTWDYQLRYAMLVHGRLSIIPNVNLVSNIGFGPAATHTISNGVTANLPTESIKFPLKHPIGIYANNQKDERYTNMIRKSTPSLMQRALSKVRRYM